MVCGCGPNCSQDGYCSHCYHAGTSTSSGTDCSKGCDSACAGGDFGRYDEGFSGVESRIDDAGGGWRTGSGVG